MSFLCCVFILFFFFNDTATTVFYPYLHTLSLHDALPIYAGLQLDRDPAELGRHPRRVELYLEEIVLGGDRDQAIGVLAVVEAVLEPSQAIVDLLDRKSTRLNSSH